MKKRDIEAMTADAELWETRQLGASAKHVKVVSDEEEKAIDAGLGLQLISIRLTKILIEQLKGLAKLEGLGYQPFVRQVLTKYAKENEHKLDSMLSATEAAERAEQLFTQAMKYMAVIPSLKPMSNECIEAESDYSTALRKANALFCGANEIANDPVLKRHARLRMAQIKELCEADLKVAHDKRKYKRAG